MPTNPLKRHPKVAAEPEFDDNPQVRSAGGTRVGSALFGWLNAVGTFIVVNTIVDGIVARAGGTMPGNVRAALDATRGQGITAVAWSGAIALLILAFVSYVAGGYVAGRMARFNGIRQGLVVWLWGAVTAAVVSLIVEASSAKYSALYRVDLFPRLQVGSMHGTGAEIITAVVLAAAGLLGALLGGLAGMAYHRRVDRATVR